MSKIYKKYRKEIQQLLNVDDLTMEVLEDEYDRKTVNGLLSKYTCFFYVLLSIITRCLYLLLGVSSKVEPDDEDFIFVSCPDSIFRTKTIDMIAHGLKYQIVYLPSFHIMASLRYARYFRKKGINAVFPTFSVKDVVKAKNTHKAIKKIVFGNDNQNDNEIFYFQMITYLIYDNLVERVFSNASSFKGKWLMEHQKFFFIPLIALLRKSKIETIMLQHGCFFKPSFNYLPLFTDKVLTCCEREKQIYCNHGVNPNQVIVFGAPLQTLSSQAQTATSEFDLLLMMTQFQVNGELQISVLKYLKTIHPELKVLVRMRPRSRVNDLKCLGKDIEGFVVSEPTISIATDLSRVEKVICFSEDATFEVLSAHKSFLLAGTKETMDKEMYEKCTTEDNYKEQIELLLKQPSYSPFSEEENIYMMGEQRVDVLHDRFVSFIKS